MLHKAATLAVLYKKCSSARRCQGWTRERKEPFLKVHMEANVVSRVLKEKLNTPQRERKAVMLGVVDELRTAAPSKISGTPEHGSASDE